MKPNPPQSASVLAIAPCSRGFGFAVLDEGSLVDWGVKLITKDKNNRCVTTANELILHYHPKVIILPDTMKARRAPRIKRLAQRIPEAAGERKIRVKLLSLDQVKKALLPEGHGTKFDIANLIAKQFPEELGHRLPPKRRAWMSEDYRMEIFNAVALGLIGGTVKLTKSSQPFGERSVGDSPIV